MEQEKNPGEIRKIKKEQGAQKNEKGARKIASKEQAVENLKEQGRRGKIVKGARSTDHRQRLQNRHTLAINNT